MTASGDEQPLKLPSPTHYKRTMRCAICSESWIVVYPKGCPEVKCPACGYMNDIREFGK
jgi:hypothetical protein